MYLAIQIFLAFYVLMIVATLGLLLIGIWLDYKNNPRFKEEIYEASNSKNHIVAVLQLAVTGVLLCVCWPYLIFYIRKMIRNGNF